MKDFASVVYQLILISILLRVVAAESPTGTYAPGEVQCPNFSSFIREGNALSKDEVSWINSRQQKTTDALIEYLEKVGLTDDLDIDQLKGTKSLNSTFTSNSSSIDRNGINIAVAMSGGGYRAMLAGAGQMAALDNRTEDANELGLGGILQSSNYISALSGGSFLVGSLAMQDWPSIHEVVMENPYDVWNLTETRQLVDTSGTWTVVFPILFNNLNWALSHLNNWVANKSKKWGIKYDLENKKDAGYPTSITDPWGRGLAYQLFPKGDNNHDVSSTFSDVRNKKSFMNHDMPFPLFTGIGRKPDTTVFHLNSTIFEFNPFEMGSFDPSVNTFTDIRYLGTDYDNGVPQSDKCVAGYDNAAFTIGTSASLFNDFLNTLVCDDCNTLNFAVKWVLKNFLNYLSKTHQDIALYKPNPFKNSEYAKSTLVVESDTLYVMDGGLAGETLAISSLMTTHRNLDLVFTMDNSANWPNGQPLIDAYDRQFSDQGKSLVVPYVPDSNTFLHNNLTAKPTFFGCDAKNLTDLVKDDVIPPIVVYVANRPFSFYSNTSLFQLTYTDEEKKGMIRNGFETVSRLNGTIDENWPKCVGCAMIKREQERQGVEPSDECQECFKEYCWDGKTFETDEPYYPPVNFTNSGLTNDSFSLVGAGANTTVPTSGGGIFGLKKRLFEDKNHVYS